MFRKATLLVFVISALALANVASAFSFSSIRAENVIHPGAQIKWMTDIAGDSKVFYGTSPGSYPNSVLGDCSATAATTDHCVNLTSLTASTRYYYIVKSADTGGMEHASGENY